MWRNIRVAILLLVLIWAAGHTWLERITSTGWKEPLWVGIFPVNADGSVTKRPFDHVTAAGDGAGFHHMHRLDLLMCLYKRVFEFGPDSGARAERVRDAFIACQWYIHTGRAAQTPRRIHQHLSGIGQIFS